MFNYPQLEPSEESRDYQQEFGGYNHNLRISDYEFYDEKNMTGDFYPVLSPRKKRGYIQKHKYIDSIICKGKLCVLCDDDTHSIGLNRTLKLYIENELITAFQKVYFTKGNQHFPPQPDKWYEFKMLGVGAFLVIFRKAKDEYFSEAWYINTQDLSDYGELNASTTMNSTGSASDLLKAKKVLFTPCTREGENFIYDDNTNKNYVFVQATPPDTTDLRNGQRWLDTSDDKHYLKVWSKPQSMWTTLNTTFIKIHKPEDNSVGFRDFKKGDAVELSIPHLNLENDPNLVVEPQYEKLYQQIKSILTNIVIEDIADDYSYIIVSGFLDRECWLRSQNNGNQIDEQIYLSIKRQIPYMDYICEYNNRIWGCRYGANRKGDFVNEIYACKQGDFKNWTVYQGISTDSYAATVGSDEAFTGCTAFQNNILFFKENCFHKLLGTMPSNYQIQEIKARGVQKGSEKSLCLVNETLFYKSYNDICYYDGSLPTSVSESLGSTHYKNAIFGSIGSKLYANMQDSENNWHLFTYDLDKGLWHKEDNIHLVSMCAVGTDLYFVDIEGNIGTLTGTGTVEDDFEWFAESGPIGYSTPDNKHVGRMTIRLQKPEDSSIRILICYDEEEEWIAVSELLTESGTKSFSIPIIPHRCDCFRLRIEGKGDCKIYSLCKTIESGSDEYVY